MPDHDGDPMAVGAGSSAGPGDASGAVAEMMGAARSSTNLPGLFRRRFYFHCRCPERGECGALQLVLHQKTPTPCSRVPRPFSVYRKRKLENRDLKSWRKSTRSKPQSGRAVPDDEANKEPEAPNDVRLPPRAPIDTPRAGGARRRPTSANVRGHNVGPRRPASRASFFAACGRAHQAPCLQPFRCGCRVPLLCAHAAGCVVSK